MCELLTSNDTQANFLGRMPLNIETKSQKWLGQIGRVRDLQLNPLSSFYIMPSGVVQRLSGQLEIIF